MMLFEKNNKDDYKGEEDHKGEEDDEVWFTG